MDSEKQTDVNMKAAKMLYPNDNFKPPFGSHSTIQSESSGLTDAFNIFTNAQDLIYTVHALLRHNVVILQLDDGRFDWVFYETDTYSMNGGGNYSDYTTAVAAAVMAVNDG